MPLDAIMQALLTPLQAIPDIGQVYPYERIALEPTTLNGTIGPLPALRYWCLSRAGTVETWRSNCSVERLHRLRLTGFLALDDPAASERVMQDLLDAVQAALSQVVTAATLLAEHTRALDAVLLRLRALEQEQQALCQQRLRLEGAIAALQMLQDAARVSDVSQGGISGVDHVPGAAGGA